MHDLPPENPSHRAWVGGLWEPSLAPKSHGLPRSRPRSSPSVGVAWGLYARMVSIELGIPLPVIGPAPMPEGSTPGDALRNSLDPAARAERLWFNRYWVAGHHNVPGIASSAPAVLLADIASVASRTASLVTCGRREDERTRRRA
jgi:hypothetical protein